MPAIELQNVSKIHPLRSARARSLKRALLALFSRRGREETVSALEDISLTVAAGRSLGIVGANGAGKSSMLRLIAGITEPTRGEVRVEGRVLPMLELGAGFHPDLSGYDNIFLQGTLLGLSRGHIQALLPSIVDFAEIEDFIHMPVRQYSSGMYLRLGFAISIHMDPDVLLIDEAFSVGDLYFQEKCFRKIQELQRQGRTLLIVTHDIDVVERLCDEAIWIDKGRIVARGKPVEVAHLYKKASFEMNYPRPVPLAFGEQASVSTGRYGTGAVTFDYLDFLDGEGNLCNAFENGAAMTVRLRYQVNEPVREAECVIAIQSYRNHSHGAAVISTEEMRRSVRLNDGGGELLFHIDALHLAPWRYIVSVLLLDGARLNVSSAHDIHMRIYTFYVMPKAGLSELAALEMPCDWRQASTEQAMP